MKIATEILAAIDKMHLAEVPPRTMLTKQLAEALAREVDRIVGAALDSKLGVGTWSAADLGQSGRLTSTPEAGYTVFRLDGEVIARLCVEFDQSEPGVLTGRVIMAGWKPGPVSVTGRIAEEPSHVR